MISKIKNLLPWKLIDFMKVVIHEFTTDNCPHLAAAISYYFLFSLFPLTLAVISAMGFVLRSPALEAQVIKGIGDLLPVSGDFITGTIRGVVSARGATGIVATIGLIWGGTSVFNAIRKALNTAWGIRRPHPFIHARLLELVMMAGAGSLLLISVSLTTSVRIIRELNQPIFMSILLHNGFFWHSIVILISLTITFLVFIFLYWIVPNMAVRWRGIWVGALAAAICFEVTKSAFIWFVGNFTQYNLVYGPVGTIIALLVWTYVSAIIFLFFAKVTSVYARRHPASQRI
ncbi:YihY/virulence factor BrkB family protein [Chloroflexota bacterium]